MAEGSSISPSTEEEDVFSSSTEEEGVFKSLYLPSFYDEYMDLDKYPPERYKAELSKKNWLTPELINEISACAPTRIEIDPTRDNLRDKVAHERATKRLFPKGRIFASHVQLGQVAEKFGNLWAFQITRPGCSIACHFSKPTYLSRSKGFRKTDESMKSKVNCPFRINYTKLGCRRHLRVRKTASDAPGDQNSVPSKVYFRVQISSTSPHHCCKLDTPSHRIAIQNSGKFVMEPEKFGSIIRDLQSDINMKRYLLRDKLKYLVPQYLLNRPKFLDNFRNRVINQFMNGVESTDVTLEECNVLLDPGPCAADEIIMNDTNLYSENLRALLRKTISGNAGDIWDVKSYMEAILKKSPGFCYRIQYDPTTGRPLGVCWMFVEMRENLLRFADIIYLDACKRRHNKPGWPYHAVVVLDNEKRVCPVCESLSIAESNANYGFLLESCMKFEPRWNPRDVRLIFADQLITEQLLIDVGINESCILHGDRYHLLHKVFPDIFKTDWESLKHHVTEMIDATTQETWNELYDDASHKVTGNPILFRKLEKVHENPRYYSKWYLLSIEGNQDRNGSVPSEINHSSMQSHLGHRNSFSLPENILRLFTRYETQIGIKLNLEMKRKSKRQEYRAKEYTGPRKEDHIKACQTLSDFAFKRYASNVVKHLQSVVDDEGYIHVWRSTLPWSEKEECRNYVTYVQGDRCICHERISFQWQCPHELAADGCLVLEKWHHRWYNQDTYRVSFPDHKMPNVRDSYRNPELGDQYQTETSTEEDTSSSFRDEILCDPYNDHSTVSVMTDQEQPLEQTPYQEEDGSSICHKFSYVELSTLSEQYLRLIKSDKIHMSNFHSTLLQLLRRAESGLSTHVTFGTTISCEDRHINSPVKAALRQDRRVSRLTSRHERGTLYKKNARKKRKTLSSLSGNDAKHVDYNRRSKCCTFCGGQGHRLQSCRKKLEYGNMLPMDEQFKLEYTKQLKYHNHFIISHRHEGRLAIKNSIPSCKGIVLHEKLSHDTLSISLIEKGTGDLHRVYRHYPFDIEKVCTYINTGVLSRIIISNLQVYRKITGSVTGIDDMICSYNQPLSQNSYTPIGQQNTYQVSRGLSAAEVLYGTKPPSQETYPYLSPDRSYQRGHI